MVTLKKKLRTHAVNFSASVPPVRSLYKWEHDRVQPRLQAYFGDRSNRARYGSDAPRFAERLWVAPRHVQHAAFGIGRSGRVETGSWPTGHQRPIEEDPVLCAAVARWMIGLPWEETGEVERMERVIRRKGTVKGCGTRKDILARCAQLDAIFEVIKREQRVRPHGEVVPQTFREWGGIGMHIGPHGIPIRAENGRHRFAIAWILEIPLIPVRIGVVHHSALHLLNDLRHPSPRGSPY